MGILSNSALILFIVFQMISEIEQGTSNDKIHKLEEKNSGLLLAWCELSPCYGFFQQFKDVHVSLRVLIVTYLLSVPFCKNSLRFNECPACYVTHK